MDNEPNATINSEVKVKKSKPTSEKSLYTKSRLDRKLVTSCGTNSKRSVMTESKTQKNKSNSITLEISNVRPQLKTVKTKK